MKISDEAIKHAYTKFLGLEAPSNLNESKLRKFVLDKFLRRPSLFHVTDEDIEITAEGIVGIILSMAKQFDEDYETQFGGD